MSPSDSAGDLNIVNLIIKGDENDKSSDGFELNSIMKARKSGTAASGHWIVFFVVPKARLSTE